MKTDNIGKNLRAWAKDRGYRLAWGKVSMIETVSAQFDALKAQDAFDPFFYEEWLHFFEQSRGLLSPHFQSLILIAVPRPAHRVTFEYGDDRFETTIPPTYVDDNKIRDRMPDDLDADLFQGRHRLEILRAPLKAIAARLGLIAYGRNNIAYTREMGSYLQLVGLVTDAEIEPPYDQPTREPVMLDECENCKLCRKACPTGAIGNDRFLLHAERCLTFHNEGTHPWPENLPRSIHHCLVGCMICQRVCPLNKELPEYVDAGVSFTAEETAKILSDERDESDPIWLGIRAKFDQLDILDYESILGRNLRALLA